jgi:hypothetical protein
MGAWGAGYDTQTSSDIRWVYVVCPRPFHCICHRGVATIAGSVHLKISNLGRKGEAWPHPKQHYPVPQGPPFSSIDWPPECHRQSHLNHTASSRPKHTTASRQCCHTARTSAHLISFGDRATPPHSNHILLHHRRLPSGPTALVYTASLIDTPSPLTAHGSTGRCSKVTLCRTYPHPSPKSSRSLHRQARIATPKCKLHALAHTLPETRL